MFLELQAWKFLSMDKFTVSVSIHVLPCMFYCYLVYTRNTDLNILELKFTLLRTHSHPQLYFGHTNNTNLSYPEASEEPGASRKHKASLNSALFPYLTP